MIDRLVKLANHLDEKGLTKEADYLDDIINKIAETPIQRNLPLEEEMTAETDNEPAVVVEAPEEGKFPKRKTSPQAFKDKAERGRPMSSSAKKALEGGEITI